MNWNTGNIGTELVARLSARLSLVNLLGDAKHIRPEGTGKELYDCINYAFDDIPDSYNCHIHNVTLNLYIDTRDDNGKSGYKNGQAIAAEMYEELDHSNQEPNSAAYLDLSRFGYRVLEQSVNFNPGPRETGGNPPTYRAPMRLNLVVIDDNT